MKVIDGVYVVRENAERLQWRHQMEGYPPPLAVKDWVVGGLWPDASSRSRLATVLEGSTPLLVIMEERTASVVLPVEHVPQVPNGVFVEDDSDGVLTMALPELDWLPDSDRRRGQRFAADARRRLAAESPLCPSTLMLENGDAASRCVRFVMLPFLSSVSAKTLRLAVEAAFGVSQRLSRKDLTGLDRKPDTVDSTVGHCDYLHMQARGDARALATTAGEAPS